MRIVIDTNVAVSGLLWGGPPNQILKWARDRFLQILACNKTMDELNKILQYNKFSGRLSDLGSSPQKAMSYFVPLMTFVPDPKPVPVIIKADPFDNLFLALAASNGAALIVSGDRHLLDLKSWEHIQIVTPREGVELILRLRDPSCSWSA